MHLPELLALVAVVMIIAGAWLRWRLAAYCSDAEEDAKDGKITPHQARKRITQYNWLCPLLTMLGVGLLILAVFVPADK